MSGTRERINSLLDDGSFCLMDDLEPSMHRLGVGTIHGRTVYCCEGISTLARGLDVQECFRRKIKWLESILADPAPVVWLHDFPKQEAGGRTPIPANSESLLASNRDSVGRSFCLQARLDGLTPQIAILFSDAGAAQSFSVRLADFTVMIRGTHTWVGRPDAVKLMLGARPDAEELGGAEMHCSVSGVGDVFAENEREAIEWARNCIGCLPLRAGEMLPSTTGRAPASMPDDIRQIIPADLNHPFDMRRVMQCLLDADTWLGVRERYAPEVITGFGRIDGLPVGIVANDSSTRAGLLHPQSCRKIAKFVRFCDVYRIPMLFLCDNPGLMVGRACECAGMITEAADLMRVLARATVMRVCLVVRKAYTVGLYVMSGPGFDPARFWAAPDASISVFGPKALDRFAADRDLSEQAMTNIRAMRASALDPQRFIEKGCLDAVIEWTDIRETLVDTFAGYRHRIITKRNTENEGASGLQYGDES